VAEPGNPADLAKAIRELLADASYAADLGAAAAERVKTQFSQDRMLSAMKEIYPGAV